MSSKPDNTFRRTWDKEAYAEKAKERAQAEEDELNNRRDKHRELVVRAPLAREATIQRDYKAELVAKIGTKQIVNLETGEGSGFVCAESGKVLRDSLSYLDHINGKKQQRALGLSMRVERSTLDQVKERFASHKRKKEEAERAAANPISFGDRVKGLEDDEERERAERAERKRRKKEEEASAKAAAKAEEEADADPEMLALMGFSGFGPKK